MSAIDLHRLRMVIQQIGIEPAYRLTVYGDKEKTRHADFSSAPALLTALLTALPDFDTSGLSLDPMNTGQGSIVFTGAIDLNDRQLGLLGLV